MPQFIDRRQFLQNSLGLAGIAARSTKVDRSSSLERAKPATVPGMAQADYRRIPRRRGPHARRSCIGDCCQCSTVNHGAPTHG